MTSQSEMRWLVFGASCVMVILEIILPKLVILRWYELNLIEFLPVFYLGLGGGAIVAAFSPRAWISRSVPVALALCILIAGAAVVIAEDFQVIKYATALPFVPIGILLGQVFASDDSHYVYALDLLGIAAGVVVLTVFLGALGGETLFLLLVAVPVLFAFRGAKWFFRAALWLAVGAIVATPWVLAPKLPPWDFFKLRMALVDPAADLDLHHSFDLEKFPSGPEHVTIARSRWDLVARTDLGRTTGSPLNYLLGPAYCLTGQCIRNPRYENDTGYSFYYNGKWMNAVVPEYFLRTDFLLATTDATALVIGMGGGADIPGLRARGVKQIDGAEINAAATYLFSEDLVQEIVGTASRPTALYPLDGRAVVELAQAQYDVILLNGAELYIPMPYSRVYLESYLYTVEAFRAYFRALSDDGRLYIGKFGSYDSRANDEAYKLVLTAMTALYAEGITQPERHLQLLAFPISATVHNTDQIIGINLLKKPLTTERNGQYLAVLQPPFVNIFSPLDPEFSAGTHPNLLAPEIWAFGDALREGSEAAYFRTQGAHLEPATDDRPFFYNFDVDRSYNAANLQRVIFLTAAFIFMPLFVILAVALFRNRAGNVWRAGILSLRDVPVVAALALAGLLFGALQATVGQSFHVYLGSPVYSLLAIFCMFPLMSAVASLMSRRITPRGVAIALVAIALLLPLLQSYSGELLRHLRFSNSWARFFSVSVMLAPIALASGITFPWLVTPFRAVNTKLVSLLYAWNLGFTVIGSALALVWANEHGFRTAGLNLVIGYGLLAVLILAAPKLREHPAGESQQVETV